MFRALVLGALGSLALAGCNKKTPPVSQEPDEAPRASGEAAQTPKASDEIILFDGQSLEGWEPVEFGGQGEVRVEDGAMILGYGEMLTGVKLQSEPPFKVDYEISLEAKRIDGTDFFCGLTFPVKETHVTFVVGGWGGGIVGISSVDYMDAVDNMTASVHAFEDKKWYSVRIRVLKEYIQAWLDEKNVVNIKTTGHHLGLRPGDIELTLPLGLSSYQTTAAIRNIRVRAVDPSEVDLNELPEF